ncbi:ImmA/IrrE family metallo-endopeptidase [Microbacterium sp. BH-3-3-3]|uniref:ImmA/IrrE family metallo-endopeptidase n=1 Tax=Microbacterium sp. BH-3-3-3 TaxID=1906742 RepID=UPI0011A9B493|nr:ImmA/IrrE family metallo-endopeptidase [Microbacterium sp. BH-3-3-3]
MRDMDFSQDDLGESRAREFQSRYEITAPVLDLPAIASRVFHADVAFMKMPAVADAVTKRDPETEVVLIAIATSDNPERQRFSLAHEIGHLVFGHLHTPEKDDASELQAHAFARHLLLPRHELEAFFTGGGNDGGGLRMLSNIVEHFRVSGQVAAIQLRRFGYIGESLASEWSSAEASSLALRYGWADARDIRVKESLTSLPPARMLANATDAYLLHQLPLEAVAVVEGAPVEQLRRRFEAEGIVPPVTGGELSLDDL